MPTYKACDECFAVVIEQNEEGVDGGTLIIIKATEEAIVAEEGPLVLVGISNLGYFRCYFCGHDEIDAHILTTKGG